MYVATVRTSRNEGGLVVVKEVVGGNDDDDNDKDDGTTIALPVVRFMGNQVRTGKSLLVGRGGNGCASNERAGDDDNIDGGMRNDSSDQGNPPSSPGWLVVSKCKRGIVGGLALLLEHLAFDG